jgi:hypothetical protein
MCGGAIVADFVPADARRPATDDTMSASLLSSGTLYIIYLPITGLLPFSACMHATIEIV